MRFRFSRSKISCTPLASLPFSKLNMKDPKALRELGGVKFAAAAAAAAFRFAKINSRNSKTNGSRRRNRLSHAHRHSTSRQDPLLRLQRRVVNALQ